MAGILMRLLFRPGWRLRCVDPPIGWLQLRPGDELAIRLQLTCYLTSRWARDVVVNELRLRVGNGDREYLAVGVEATDAADEPFPDSPRFAVGSGAPHHAFVEFASRDPELASILAEPGPPIPVVVEALLNDALAFRNIATLELSHDEVLYVGDGWRRTATGRELEA